MVIKKLSVLRKQEGAEPFPVLIETWSGDGKSRETTEYGAGGEVLHILKMGYDEKSRQVFREDNFPQDQMTTVIKTEYPDNVFQKIEREFYIDGSNSRMVSIYDDSNGRIQSIEKYDDENSKECSERQIFEYDGDGRLLRHETFDAGGDSIEIKTWIYGDDTRLKSAESAKEGKRIFSELFYDAEGRLSRQVSSEDGVVVEEIEYEYTGEGEARTERIKNSAVDLERRYDSDGRLIYEERYIHMTGHRDHIIKISLEYNEKALLKTEKCLDSYYPENNYTNSYEYEYFPE
jgi:hypothetical protein